MANRNWSNGGKVFQMESSPVTISCTFTVNSTDSAGLGITSLKGPTVSAVYMNTSATPADNNPNPAAGTIVLQLQDNYNRTIVPMKHSIQSPLSGSSLLVASAGLTVGVAYVITILGTTTTAAWHALGVPAGVTPAVGVSFIAAATSALGTGAVQITAAAGSGVASIEIVGEPNMSIAPDGLQNQGFGAQIILQCRDYAGAIVAPANGSIISLELLLSNSSVTVQGN